MSPSPQDKSQSREVGYDEVNGHKIAYDPRDISESAERIKQPKLTLMEEVLLLGLKDKQVRYIGVKQDCARADKSSQRASYPSGMITSPMPSEAVSCWS